MDGTFAVEEARTLMPALLKQAAGLAPSEALDLRWTLRRVIASLDESSR